MQENYYPRTDELCKNECKPLKVHADKYGKIMLGGENVPWRVEDYRSADYFVNKVYTVFTYTLDPIED